MLQKMTVPILALLVLLSTACTQVNPTELANTSPEVQDSSINAALVETERITACTGELTSANQEGPYYTKDSPERQSLVEAGMPGKAVLIQGTVFNQDCTPLAGAKVDFWQTDAEGNYDNEGYRLRGHGLTNENGSYSIETIAPGLYPGRPAHIHVKVFSPQGRELLTTQLYFPGSEGSSDVRVAPDLLVTYQGEDEQGRELVVFNFIVQE